MNEQALLESIRKMNANLTKAYAATATATVDAIINNAVLRIADTVVLTLPPAASSLANVCRKVLSDGAAYVSVAAGFGGAGDNFVKATLADGEYVTVYCDGTSWYLLHNEPPATA